MFRKAAVILFAITWEAVLTSNHCLQLLLQGKLPCKLFIVFMKAAQKLFAVAGEAVLNIVYCCNMESCPTSCSLCVWKLQSNYLLLQEKLFYILSTVVTGQAVLQAVHFVDESCCQIVRCCRRSCSTHCLLLLQGKLSYKLGLLLFVPPSPILIHLILAYR